MKAVFLDRDGVLNVDHGYVGDPSRLDVVAGAGQALVRLKAEGFFIAVVTNQSGIAKGYFTEAQYRHVMNVLLQRLAEQGARIDTVRMCPYLPDAHIPVYAHPNHPWRKPNPGMILDIIAKYGVEPKNSFLIGDKASDISAAMAAGVKGYLFEGQGFSERLDQFVNRIL